MVKVSCRVVVVASSYACIRRRYGRRATVRTVPLSSITLPRDHAQFTHLFFYSTDCLRATSARCTAAAREHQLNTGGILIVITTLKTITSLS